MARIVIQNTLFFGRAKASALTIPWCTYTDPEIAHVGLYEREARERGIDLHTITVEMSGVDRAITRRRDGGVSHGPPREGQRSHPRSDARGAARGRHDRRDLTGHDRQPGSRRDRQNDPLPSHAGGGHQEGRDAYNRTRPTPRVKRFFERLLAWRR